MAKPRKNTRVTSKQEKSRPQLSNAQLKLFGFAMLPVLLIALIIFVRHWLHDSDNLRINDVQVVGKIQHVDAEAVKKIIEPFTKTNLQLLDVENLERELEFEPWIRSVAITKMWPSHVLVEITEQQPIAFWGNDRMVNNYGEVFDASLPEKKGVMPVLYSSDDNGLEMIKKYKEVQQWLGKLPVGVNEFVEDARGAWKLRLTNGIQLNVGREEQQKRLRRFVVGYLKTLADERKDIAVVDLRYTNGFAVSWR
ncbi:MAG: Cell division protein FtsQ [uncultured Thiotrichaceae bacterium]|uniref:Cell division protein FtsQ n=1 Tax=uncultured Thiotrichaceae bacterium TaxID=298394 RepID=A0A6S6TBC0_9GAMM|nr:MAG: Cell division protein FtsQ [uncultured Thiotrichaceae bacterium]